MRLASTFACVVVVGFTACEGDTALVRSYGNSTSTTARRDAGAPSAPTPTDEPAPAPAPTTTPAASWCASDCDCPSGQRCVSTGGGELASNECQPGPSSCMLTCASTCAAGTQCVNGSCEIAPCVGTNCTSSFTTSVQGTYSTYYELDIHEFAAQAAEVGQLLDLLSAILSGQGANCSHQSTPQGQLLCIVFNLGAQNLHAPPWVSQLFSVLSDAFKFGNKPIRARGVMQLAEGQGGALYAGEQWSEMWLDYNGQLLNVMHSPSIGANGQLAVTVKAFGGTRSATEVFLGARDIEFDVNKLLENLFGVMISAATNGQAHDIEGVIELGLCSTLSHTSSNYLLCRTAAHQFASNFDFSTGLGGVTITQQRATIYDLDGNGFADALGLPAARGDVAGSMSNGFVDGALGAAPASSWYGTK